LILLDYILATAKIQKVELKTVTLSLGVNVLENPGIFSSQNLHTSSQGVTNLKLKRNYSPSKGKFKGSLLL